MTIIQRFEPGHLDPQIADFLDDYNQKTANQADTIPEEFIEGLREVGAFLFLNKMVTKQPAEVASIDTIHIPSQNNRVVELRIYRPNDASDLPIILFIHGGGWCVGSLNTHDALARSFAVGSHAIVVSVGYNLAPEHKYPAGLEDVQTAYEWVRKNIKTLQANGQIALLGDSAGGNLAACLCLKCKNENRPFPSFQVLIYPPTDLSTMQTASHRQFNPGSYYLTEGQLKAYRKMYLGDARKAFEVYTSPLLANDLSGLPPTILCTAEFDPVRDEGEAYARKLAAAEVPVHCIRYNGMIHAFLQMDRISDKAIIAQKELNELVKSYFEKY